MKALFLIIVGMLLFGCVQTGGEITEEKEPIVVNITVEGGAPPEEAQPAAEQPAAEEEAEVEEVEDPLTSLSQKEVSVNTKDGWKIYGTVYYSQFSPPTILIILIPMAGHDRSSYDKLILPLHEAVPGADILALDLRGHGKSTNIGTYTNFRAGDYRAAKNDLEAMVSYFSVARPSISTYYIVGASIGSSVALDYASGHGEVARVVMLSPGTEYSGFDITDDAEEYLHGLYITTGSEDSYSAASANQIYSMSPSDNKELKLYYGISAHGTDLFDATESSDKPVLEWIVDKLK